MSQDALASHDGAEPITGLFGKFSATTVYIGGPNGLSHTLSMDHAVQFVNWLGSAATHRSHQAVQPNGRTSGVFALSFGTREEPEPIGATGLTARRDDDTVHISGACGISHDLTIDDTALLLNWFGRKCDKYWGEMAPDIRASLLAPGAIFQFPVGPVKRFHEPVANQSHPGDDSATG